MFSVFFKGFGIGSSIGTLSPLFVDLPRLAKLMQVGIFMDGGVAGSTLKDFRYFLSQNNYAYVLM